MTKSEALAILRSRYYPVMSSVNAIPPKLALIRACARLAKHREKRHG